MHVGVVLDGNRRYAVREGIPKLEGHRKGAETAKKLIVEWAPSLGITELSLYMFSMQNFKRSKVEVEYLMKLFSRFLKDTLADTVVDEKKIRVRFTGRISLLSKDIQKMMHELMERTSSYGGLVLNLCIAYGGREEIVDAVKSIVSEGVPESDITMDLLTEHMYIQNEPQLIIRTGGAHRTSNFLVWQSTYSEWFFPEKFWPEFTKEDLAGILEEFGNRERRFGK